MRLHLQSMLVETLVPMTSGVLCITCDERGDSFEAARDTRWSYARFDPFDATASIDLMECLSLPLLPDAALASKLRDIAKGQREIVANEPGPISRARRESGAEGYAWVAAHVLQVSREMPSRIAALDGRHVVAAYRNGCVDVKFRVVDVLAGTVELEMDGAAVAAHFGGAARYERSQEEQEALDYLRDELGDDAAHLPPNRGTLPSRATLIAAGDGLILFTLVARETSGYVVLSYSDRKLTNARALGLDHYGWRVGAIAHGRIVVSCRGLPGRNPQVAIIDQASDRLRSVEVDKDRDPVRAIVANEAQVAWLPQFAGYALRIDLEKAHVERAKIRKGMSDHELMEVAVSPDGNWLLTSSRDDDTRPLQLTNLEQTEFFALPPAESWLVSGQPSAYPCLRRSPGFAFVRGRAEALVRGVRRPVSGLAPFASPRQRDASYRPVRLSKQLLERIQPTSLEACVQKLDELYSPGLAFRATRLKSEPSRAGTSKTGGLPDLAHGAAWPRYKGTPMAFLAQFNLEEVHAANPCGRLPRFGLLSFFRAVDPEYGGPMWYDTEARPDAGMVLFAPDIDELERAAAPSHFATGQPNFVTPPCAMTFSTARPFPAIDGLHLSGHDMDEEEREDFLALNRTIDFGDENDHRRHQLLGYRDHHRWPELEAERMANGLDQFGAFDAKSDAGKALLRAATGWIPLLELSSCDIANWMWGDGGSLLWMIRASDLDVPRFDRAIAVSAR